MVSNMAEQLGIDVLGPFAICGGMVLRPAQTIDFKLDDLGGLSFIMHGGSLRATARPVSGVDQHWVRCGQASLYIKAARYLRGDEFRSFVAQEFARSVGHESDMVDWSIYPAADAFRDGGYYESSSFEAMRHQAVSLTIENGSEIDVMKYLPLSRGLPSAARHDYRFRA